MKLVKTIEFGHFVISNVKNDSEMTENDRKRLSFGTI